MKVFREEIIHAVSFTSQFFSSCRGGVSSKHVGGTNQMGALMLEY